MSWTRRELPILIASIIGVLIILDYVAVVPGIHESAGYLINWSMILAAFAYGIGALSIIQRESRRIVTRGKYWTYSAVQLAFLFLTLGIGITLTTNHPLYDLLFFGMLAPLNVTMSSMLAFYLASAAYRVFRARNIEAGLLLVAAVFVMFRNAPIGGMIWSGFPPIGDWFLNVWAVSSERGIQIGAAIASVGFAVLILIGRETRWLGRGE